MIRTLRFSGALACIPFLASCHIDDDDCHWHIVSTGLWVFHCHSDSSHLHSEFTTSELVVAATDSPSDEVRNVFVTVNELKLRSIELEQEFELGAVYESDSGHRLDLLSLRGPEDKQLYDVLLPTTNVLSGVYESVEIALDEPTLVLETGVVVATEEILFANRLRIDFEEPLVLGPADIAFVVLDFDVERSLAGPGEALGPTPTSTERWRLRPLVHVELLREESAGDKLRTVNLTGEIGAIDRDRGELSVELSNERGALVALPTVDTMILDAASEDVGLDGLDVGSWVTMRGILGADGAFHPDRIVSEENLRVSTGPDPATEILDFDRIRGARSPANEERIRGVIAGIDRDTRTVVATNGVAEHRVHVPEGSPIVLLETAGEFLRQRRLPFNAIQIGASVEASRSIGAVDASVLVLSPPDTD